MVEEPPADYGRFTTGIPRTPPASHTAAAARRPRCSSAGTPIPTSTGPRSPTASRIAADEGARLVCLQELTLSPLLRDRRPTARTARGVAPEPLPGGPTYRVRRGARRARRGARARVAVRAGRATAGSASTPRSSSRPTATLRRAHPQAAHPGHRRLLRGPLLPARAGESGDPFPVSADRRAASSASRPAGTSGSPSSRARTRCAAPRCSSTRPRSAPSPTTRTSTPSRCGSR